MRTVRVSAAWIAGLALLLSGCHGGQKRPLFASAEPALDPSLTDGPVIAATPPPSVTWVDRHPLFSKPRDVYEGTASNNKLVKGAAATVVGVPVGLVGEFRQIIVGRDPVPRTAALDPPQ
jgi:hypothetical protein